MIYLIGLIALCLLFGGDRILTFIIYLAMAGFCIITVGGIIGSLYYIVK